MTHLAEIWIPEPPCHARNNSTNLTRGRMGQIPVIRCFIVQKFYMVILSVVEACRTTPRVSAQHVLSILPVAELVLLCWPTGVAKCYPAGPSRAALNLDKVLKNAKIWTTVFMVCFIILFRNSRRKDDWVKKSSKSNEKQEIRKFRHTGVQFSHIKT